MGVSLYDALQVKVCGQTCKYQHNEMCSLIRTIIFTG
jgi:hypothetical protein